MTGSVDLEEATTAVPADCPSDLETETISNKSQAKRSDRRGPKRLAERARVQMSKRGRDVAGLTDEEVVALRRGTVGNSLWRAPLGRSETEATTGMDGGETGLPPDQPKSQETLSF